MASVSADEIFDHLMALDQEEREAVIERVRQADLSGDGWTQEERDALVRVVEDRLARYARGEAQARPAEQSVERLQARLKEHREARSRS